MVSIATILFPLMVTAAGPTDGEVARTANQKQFDFWAGCWSVKNRRLDHKGEWSDRFTSEALIEPVLGGRATVEQWHGTGGSPIIGFSLRYYDLKKDRWVIALNWPQRISQGFSFMEGRFQHGRGEFFPPGHLDALPEETTRFTFSDALPDTCRWDMAHTKDKGLTWRTSWIMEFTRVDSPTALARSVNKINVPPSPRRCSAAKTAALDGLIGEWVGQGQYLQGGKSKAISDVRLRCTSMIDGCGMMMSTLYPDRATAHGQSFSALAFNARAGKWNMISLHGDASELFEFTGLIEEEGALKLETSGDKHKTRIRRQWSKRQPGSFEFTESNSDDGGRSWNDVLTLSFKKD